MIFRFLSKKFVFRSVEPAIFLSLLFASVLASRAVYGEVNPIPVTTVSAANYENAPVTSGSIVSAFGTKLATTTAIATDIDLSTSVIDLPTNLAGTTVQVDGQFASILFVSPLQVNFLIPAGTKLGTVVVKITAGDSTESNGTIVLVAVQPAIFTFNADGQGVLAGNVVRVTANNVQAREPLMQLAPATNRFVTKPIELGPEGEQVFVEVYLTGVRNANDSNGDGNLNEAFSVLLGARQIAPSFVGRHSIFPGLDQLNFEIPRALLGAGKVKLVVAGVVRGDAASNPVELEIAAPKLSLPPQPLVLATTTAQAGQRIDIRGQGFSPLRLRNTVTVGGVLAETAEVLSDRISVWVPYGAVSGVVNVRTPEWEGQTTAPLTIKTSLSGWVETPEGGALRDVLVNVVGTNLSTKTNHEGVFLLPDVPVGDVTLEVDPTPLALSVAFPKVLLKTRVQAGQDNSLPMPVKLQGDYGESVYIPEGGLAADTMLTIGLPVALLPQSGASISVIIPKGTTVRFADGRTNGRITLTYCPYNSPLVVPALASTSTPIAQLTPLGATFSNGVDLKYVSSFGGSKLWKGDQQLNSPTLGQFIELPDAQITNNVGVRFPSSFTTNRPIRETGYYFFSYLTNLPNALTNYGQVLDRDGTPARNAVVVHTRGSVRTDDSGSFTIRGGGQVQEAIYLRPSGRIDRVKLASNFRGSNVVIPGSELTLSSPESNRPPLILTPQNVSMFVHETNDLLFSVTDPDSSTDPVSSVSVGSASFVSLLPEGAGRYSLRLRPGATDFGDYTLMLAATDKFGAVATQKISLRVATPSVPPTITGPSAITVKTGEALSFDIIASDTDVGQSARLTISSVPPGGLFSYADSTRARGTYNWTPTSTQAGRYTLTFTATDNGFPALSTFKEVTITVLAQFGEWRSIGGTGPLCLGLKGTTLLMGTSTGSIERTDDDGATWTRINNGVPFSRVLSIAILGEDIFVLSEGNGIYQSSNVGDSWTKLPVLPPVPQSHLRKLYGSGDTLLAEAVADDLGFTVNSTLYLSPDRGATWSKVAGEPKGRITGFAAGANGSFASFVFQPNPSEPGQAEVYRLLKSGAIWSFSATHFQGISLSGLAQSPTKLFAGGQRTANEYGLFSSADQGITWTKTTNGLPQRNDLFPQALAAQGNHLFAFFYGATTYYSSDGGSSWRAFPIGSEPIHQFAIGEGKVYGATKFGVLVAPYQ